MVKCADCGYLTLRNIETRGLDEAEEAFREWGKVVGVKWSHPVQVGDTPFYTEDKLSRYVHQSLPICFARNKDFSSSLRELISKNYDADKVVLMVIKTERPCDKFTEWQQGFTPKEHREMLDREAMLKWQTQREDDDKKWRSGQEWRLVVIGGIIAGAFTILGGAIGAFITIWLSTPH